MNTHAHRRFTALVVSALAALATPVHAQGIAGQMDQMFGSMSNVTAPQAHMGARRGVITGGGFELRNRQVRTSLVSFDPPSIHAGCGGISAYTGSLSFISKDQITATLRAVPSAAASYAFSLALAAVSPTIEEITNKWAKELFQQSWNQIDSCKLAQSLVDNSVGPAITEYANNVNSQLRVRLNLSSDAAAGAGQGDRRNAVAETTRQRPDVAPLLLQGNLVYQALRRSNASTWYGVSGSPQSLYEDIMSLTGTVIACNAGQGDCPAPEGGQEYLAQEGAVQVFVFPPRLRLADLIDGHQGFDSEGNKVSAKGWGCAGSRAVDECLKLVDKEVRFEGLRTRLEKVFLGEGGSPGLLARYQYNGGGDFTEQEKAIFESIGPIGSMLLQLARDDLGFARTMAKEYLPVIASTLVHEFVTQVIDSVEQALALEGNDPTGQGRELLAATRLRLAEDRAVLNESRFAFESMVTAYTQSRGFRVRTARRMQSPLLGATTSN